MKIYKYIKIIMITFLITIPVNALELCTPTKEWLDYQKLSDKEKQNLIEPAYCSDIINNDKTVSNKLKNKLYNKVYASQSDSSYNSYTQGITTSPKNQYQTGLCWDFSAISVVEANAKVKGLGTLDLSEAHLAYSILADVYSDAASKVGKYNSGIGDGGTVTYAPSYFYGGYGQLNESDLRFESVLTANTEDFKKITGATYPKGKSIIQLDNYYLDNYDTNGVCTESDISTIKSNILKYGSSLSMMYMDQDLFSDDDENYYISTTNDSEYSNHAITIVGWDDSISKTHFTNATRDGAWIIKNSWGDDWSGDGLFYISYDDQHICNVTANYEVSSEKNYKYTYKSSELVGSPTLTFNNKFYMASKFNKQSTNNEILDRVSYAVGENMTYNVYLSKDNVMNDKTNWILLATGTSSKYGIKSTDLDNIEVEDDYTIILEYQVPSSKTSSVFTTCNIQDSYDNIVFAANKGFMSLDGGSTWSDMSNIDAVSPAIKCQPNIYVNSEEKEAITITNTTKENDIITVDINMINIDTEQLTYKVINNNKDVTSHFQITPNYDINKITLESDNTVSGTFTFKIEYKSITETTEFTLEEVFTPKEESNTTISENKIFTLPNENSEFRYSDLINSIDVQNTSITIKDKNDTIVTGTDVLIGTGYTIIINSTEYKVTVIGDSTGDGKINSGDLLRVLKYLKSINSLSNLELIAADCNYDNKVNSGDLLKLLKYLKGKTILSKKE